MSAGRVELFINVIWRELCMAIHQARHGHPGMTKTLDLVFDGSDWQAVITSDDFDEMADQTISLLGTRFDAKWATPLWMLGDNGRTRYMLLHLSNHDQGRKLMKECIWSVCPDGGFLARKSVDSRQQLLIEPSPDLSPLGDWIRTALQNGPQRWSELETQLLPEIWRSTHLWAVIKKLRGTGEIEASYEGKFSQRADPLLVLKRPRRGPLKG